jgi:hypothetical protein
MAFSNRYPLWDQHSHVGMCHMYSFLRWSLFSYFFVFGLWVCVLFRCTLWGNASIVYFKVHHISSSKCNVCTLKCTSLVHPIDILGCHLVEATFVIIGQIPCAFYSCYLP